MVVFAKLNCVELDVMELFSIALFRHVDMYVDVCTGMYKCGGA